MPKMQDKVVLITGGSLGIGRCLAEAFSKEGAKVFSCSRNTFPPVDVASADQVKGWIENVFQREKWIDVLINCAGIYGPIGPLETTNPTEWEKTIAINLLGTTNCIRAVIPIMKKQKRGKIINFSGGGVGGKLNPNFSAYIASKAAVAALTEVVARELEEWNIQVNAIAPGAVNTRFLDQVLVAKEKAGSSFYKQALKQKTDGGTSPELSAKLALFLASSEADPTTGKMLSAKWDDWTQFTNKSFGYLRRIDQIMFYEKNAGDK